MNGLHNTVAQALIPFRSIERYLVAYSGGLDSTVLLHILSQISTHENFTPVFTTNFTVEAVHIHHGLSPYASHWAQQCAEQCAEWSIPFRLIEVDAQPASGESPEAVARSVRYEALDKCIGPADGLLTAHHQDDQAETLLLQLLRGAGPKGLSAMPVSAAFGRGSHVRPLLQVERETLLEYANEYGLRWIEDESNTDTGFDRNYLRHEIMPRLKQRYPAAAETISRSAGLCAEASFLLDEQARHDLDIVSSSTQSLSVSALKALGEVRGRNVLHHWIDQQHLSLPTARQLQHIWQDVILSAEDSMPRVAWPRCEVRRYRDELFIGKPLPDMNCAEVFDWNPGSALTIPGLGQLLVKQLQGEGIASRFLAAQSDMGPWQIRFRQGGEQIRPAGRQQHHALKKLFQESGIPPWLRERIPLIFAGDQLVAVTGLWVDAAFAAKKDEAGILPVLRDVGTI